MGSSAYNRIKHKLSGIFFDTIPVSDFLEDELYLEICLDKREHNNTLLLLLRIMYNIMQTFVHTLTKSKITFLKDTDHKIILLKYHNRKDHIERLEEIRSFNPERIAILDLKSKGQQPLSSLRHFYKWFSSFSTTSYQLLKLNTKDISFAYKIKLITSLTYSTKNYQAYQYLLQKHKPAIVYSEYDRNQLCAPFITAAKQNHIPTVTAIHGSIYRPEGYIPFIADYVCCWGTYQKEKVITWGVSENKIAITGCQKIKIEQLTHSEINTLRTKLLRKGRRYIMLATNPIHHQEKIKLATFFCEISTDIVFKEDCFWVRLHPSEKLEEYSELITKYPNVAFTENHLINTAEAINISNIIVAHNSSIITEACVYQSNIIICNILNEPLEGTLDLAKNGYASVITNKEEFKTIFEHMLNNTASTKQDTSSLFAYTGKDAAQQLYNQFQQLLNS